MSFRELIDRWPDTLSFARDLGCNLEAARKWRSRNSVPSTYWRDMVRAAEGRRIPGVTLDSLARLAAKRNGA